ncbi:hypothetical protein [Pararcticibacter amylolyticus]|uniref:DUF4890 domain-containing protein n=1 Tax=Pararcticibacter amylolyticus TaxID=2173175 RepID=A0A2U2PJN8_9SPHI|nr:hypothetical protein [Pararcticibacter amylolyticus]PWG81611.1 hypothetical protein DDR33_07205 [Pararcticibacter amylolyticus]
MKTLIIFLTLFAGYFLTPQTLQAQSRPDSIRARQRVLNVSDQKRGQFNHYRRTLKVDSAKAEQVNKVQSEYKESMKALEEEKGISQEARIARIKALIAERNRKLESFLSPEQQEKIIPPTERETGKEVKKNN